MIIGAIAPGPMTSSARPLAVAAVISWVLTAGIGLYMLRTWIARGGLRRQRATGVGVPPAVVFSHAGAALTGLLVWIGFVKTEWDPLGWLGVGLVTTAGYGHAIGRSIALAYLRSDLAKPETRLEVEILGERRAAIVASEPIYDPENARLRM